MEESKAEQFILERPFLFLFLVCLFVWGFLCFVLFCFVYLVGVFCFVWGGGGVVLFWFVSLFCFQCYLFWFVTIWTMFKWFITCIYFVLKKEHLNKYRSLSSEANSIKNEQWTTLRLPIPSGLRLTPEPSTFGADIYPLHRGGGQTWPCSASKIKSRVYWQSNMPKQNTFHWCTSGTLWYTLIGALRKHLSGTSPLYTTGILYRVVNSDAHFILYNDSRVATFYGKHQVIWKILTNTHLEILQWCTPGCQVLWKIPTNTHLEILQWCTPGSLNKNISYTVQ